VALVSMAKLLDDARLNHYAVCYCESWNLESFVAVAEAAEALNAPVITGFNGGFLSHPKRSEPEKLTYYAALALPLRHSGIRVAFLLNETDDLRQIERGLELGFNAVMVDNERLEERTYVALVKQVVKVAHSVGAAVEGAIGLLADGAGHIKANATSPSEAKQFVESTGVDALGVSVGNVHILTEGKAPIHLDVLEAIHEAVSVPLVLHGGTGIPLERVDDYVRRGVAKINFGTGLKQAYLEAVRSKLAEYRHPMSPHPFLGMGGEEDVLVAGRDAVKRKVKELIELCGSAGQARRQDVHETGASGEPTALRV
jgi:ketose-bisphosphate aldolase